MPTEPSIMALNSGLPKKYHLDKRAADLSLSGAGDPDDLLNTVELAEWFGLSTQWLEIGRHRGYGPKFLKLSSRRVRYRRSDVLAWLAERTHRATAEYATTGGRAPEDAGDEVA